MFLPNIPSLTTTVENANQDLLLQLLKNADVSVGNWRGRLINVPGYSGEITFSKFVSRIETIYQDTFAVMYQKQKEYEEACRLNVDSSENEEKSPLFTAMENIGNAICKAITPYPEVSEEEEAELSEILWWRKEIDDELNRLVEISQDKINELAAQSCYGGLLRCWDFFLDTKYACRNIHPDDKPILEKMVQTRKNREALEEVNGRNESLPKIGNVARTILPIAAVVVGCAVAIFWKYQTFY